MSKGPLKWDITTDDLSEFSGASPAFVTFGETMLRDTPADMQRAEMAHLVHIAFAGSEFTLAMLLDGFADFIQDGVIRNLQAYCYGEVNPIKFL